MEILSSLFAEKDIQFLEKQENLFKTFQTPLLNALDIFNNVSISPLIVGEDFTYHMSFHHDVIEEHKRLIKEVQNSLKKVQRDFISIIRWYIQDTYDVKITFPHVEDLESKEICLNTLYPFILNELKGLSLIEKSLIQLKDSVRSWDISMTGKTIEIKNEFDYSGQRLSLNSLDNLTKMLKLLTLFETGKTTLSPLFNRIIDNGFNEYELDLKKAIHFKIFKNQKCIIKFNSANDAEEFLKFISEKC